MPSSIRHSLYTGHLTVRKYTNFQPNFKEFLFFQFHYKLDPRFIAIAIFVEIWKFFLKPVIIYMLLVT